MKVADEFRFPERLDVSAFLSPPPAEPAERVQYELYAVLLHIGTATGGHYFAYIRDLASNKWFKFVSSAAPRYGGEASSV